MRAPPEPLLTLAEACQRYFPGKSPCALRWMIKRRGYAHSRWGREYRLTPSQVAVIVDDLARPANPPQRGYPEATCCAAAGPPCCGHGPGHAVSGRRRGWARGSARRTASSFEAGAGRTPVSPAVGHGHLSHPG